MRAPFTWSYIRGNCKARPATWGRWSLAGPRRVVGTSGTLVAALRNGGTIVTIGAASGTPLVDQAVLAGRNIRIRGGPMAHYLRGKIVQASDAVFDAYRAGVFGDDKATSYPLSQVSPIPSSDLR